MPTSSHYHGNGEMDELCWYKLLRIVPSGFNLNPVRPALVPEQLPCWPGSVTEVPFCTTLVDGGGAVRPEHSHAPSSPHHCGKLRWPTWVSIAPSVIMLLQILSPAITRLLPEFICKDAEASERSPQMRKVIRQPPQMPLTWETSH